MSSGPTLVLVGGFLAYLVFVAGLLYMAYLEFVRRDRVE